MVIIIIAMTVPTWCCRWLLLSVAQTTQATGESTENHRTYRQEWGSIDNALSLAGIPIFKRIHDISNFAQPVGQATGP